ncbi:MAG: membrane protein insertion efficiency factor YidD [Legionellales bacterium]|nr:membrane protein insertion efficiency factor YidD [Legionellales bacterium]
MAPVRKNNGLTGALIGLIKAYQYGLRPFVGSHCRFYPTCSSYAVEALQQHGVCKGLWFICQRLLRCHPWCAGGIDPVPPIKDHREKKSDRL